MHWLIKLILKAIDQFMYVPGFRCASVSSISVISVAFSGTDVSCSLHTVDYTFNILLNTQKLLYLKKWCELTLIN